MMDVLKDDWMVEWTVDNWVVLMDKPLAAVLVVSKAALSVDWKDAHLVGLSVVGMAYSRVDWLDVVKADLKACLRVDALVGKLVDVMAVLMAVYWVATKAVRLVAWWAALMVEPLAA